MPTKRESAANREARYRARLAGASSARQRLWVAYGWLLSEAIRTHRVEEAKWAVLTIIRILRSGKPITGRVFDSMGALEEMGTHTPQGSTRVARRARLVATPSYVNPEPEDRGAQ